MKHIRNSVKGVFFLEHQGVPTATLTDFNENIKDGSLCVDRNNHDLYILKSGVWTLFASGISSGDFIPRAGTNIGLPVTGNIEMQNGVSLERGSSQVTFTNDALIFHFSDNDGNPADDCGVTMNRNIIFKSDTAITSVDANSRGNFVYKVKDNFQLFNSNDNTIFTKAEDLFLTDVNNTTILNNVKNTNINNLDNSMIEGNFDDLTIDGTDGALYTSYGDSENIFIKGTSVVSKPYYFSYTNTFRGSYGIYLEGLLAFVNIKNCTSMYGKGTMSHSATNDTHFHTYGKWSAVTSDNDGVFSLGKVELGINITDSNEISFVGKSTNINIDQSSYITNLGYISGVNISDTTDTLIVNAVNSNDVDIIGSKHLTLINNNNQIADSQIINTEDLIAFSNQRIESTSSINNILINTKDITLDNSYNNFIIGNGRKDSGNKLAFTGSVGSNNVLFGLGLTSTSVYTVGDNNFTFGDITSDINQDLKSGNILLGNNSINNTLTDNNIIISGKRSTNINHDNRGNNVFLNVGSFNVPDVDTLYVPCKFYAVVSANVFGTFDACNITSTQTWTLPDKSGTVALLSDITDGSTSGESVKFINDLYDVNTTNIINGDFLSYDLESTSWVNSGIYIESTYAELETLVGTNGLIPNVLYAFDYQTIHNIPANTGGLSGYHEGQYNDTTSIHKNDYNQTLGTFTPETEKLIIRAVSTNSFDSKAMSINYPKDKLEYDFFSNMTEDGLRSRTGKITFRHDTDRDISAYYDWKNVLFRRYQTLTSDLSGLPNYFDNPPICNIVEDRCLYVPSSVTMSSLNNEDINYFEFTGTDGKVSTWYNTDIYYDNQNGVNAENRVPVNPNARVTGAYTASEQYPVNYTLTDVVTTDHLDATYHGTTGSYYTMRLVANVNGRLNISGLDIPLNRRVLVKNQNEVSNENTLDIENGVYQLTVEGDGSTPWELTRVNDFGFNGSITTQQIIKNQYDGSDPITYYILDDKPETSIGHNLINFLPLTKGRKENFTNSGYFETFNDGITVGDYLTFPINRTFRNIHIGKMNDMPSPMATNRAWIHDTYGLGIRSNSIQTSSPSLNRAYSDVVFAPQANPISNIKIGGNTYGVSINGRASFIEIGSGCTNIAIGKDFTANGNDEMNIKIGDFNENILVHAGMNDIEIGDGNKNISLVGYTTRDVKVGHYNQQLYLNDLQFVEIGNGNLNLVLSGDIRYVSIGDNNQDNDITNCIFNFDMKDNCNDNVFKFILHGQVDSNNNSNRAYHSRFLEFGINARENYIWESYYVKIGQLISFSQPGQQFAGNYINKCTNIVIGDSSERNTMSNSNNNKFGDYCNDNEMWGNDNVLGDKCTFNKIIGDDNILDKFCGDNMLMTVSSNNKLGENSFGNIFNSAHNNVLGIGCNNNTLKGQCSSNTLGNNCSSNFFELSASNILGNNCNNNVFNTSNVKYIYRVDTTLNYGLLGTNDEVTLKTNNHNVQADDVSLGSAFTLYGADKNILGNNCHNNTFINSGENKLGDYSLNNAFGGTIDLTYNNSSGCSIDGLGYCPKDGSVFGPVLQVDGELCNNNILGDSCIGNEFTNTSSSSGSFSSGYINGQSTGAYQQNMDDIKNLLGNQPFTYLISDDYQNPGTVTHTYYTLGHSFNVLGSHSNYVKFQSTGEASYYNNVIATTSEMLITGTLNSVSISINGNGEQRISYSNTPNNEPGGGGGGYVLLDNVYSGTDFVSGNHSNVAVNLRDTGDKSLWYQDITGGSLNAPTQFSSNI